MDANFSQPLKALTPMLVTPAGMLMDSSLVQLSKALIPMLVTPAGRVMDASLEHLMKAKSPIDVKVGVPSKVTVVKFSQLLNAHIPIFVTPDPITTDVMLST